MHESRKGHWDQLELDALLQRLSTGLLCLLSTANQRTVDTLRTCRRTVVSRARGRGGDQPRVDKERIVRVPYTNRFLDSFSAAVTYPIRVLVR